MEYMGRTVSQTLCSKDPWETHCGREECFPCRSAPGKCTRQGVVYLMTCMKCKEEGRGAYYVGESARTPYDRGLEHLKAIRKGDMESPLVEHEEEYHGGLDAEITMKILWFHIQNNKLYPSPS